MKKITTAILVAACLLMSGWFAACNSFSTLQGDMKGNRVSGLIYYLPKGRIQITGDFKSGGGDGSGPAAKSAAAPAKTMAGGASGTDADEKKNFVVTIAPIVEADPSCRYFLKVDRNYFYNDDVRLGVNGKHLLSTGNATAEDQTAQIISSTAEIVAQIGRAAPSTEKAAPRPPDNVNGLLLLIQDAIIRKKVSADTTLPAASLFKLPAALGAFAPGKEPEGTDYFKFILKEDFVSLGMILKVLRYYPLERAIDLSQADEFWRQLSELLTQQAPPGKQYAQPRPFSIVFDPAAKDPCATTSSKGSSIFPRPVEFPDQKEIETFLNITIQEERQPDISLLNLIWEKRDPNVAHGIIFRALKPYRVTITSKGTWFYINESRLVLLPDTCSGHVLLMDYSRLAFVKKTTNVVFADGIPQNFAQTAPSSVLGFLAIPKGIIQAMVPLSPSLTGPPAGVQAPGTSGTTTASTPAPSPSP